MTYMRVFGPAGIPSELLGMVDWVNKVYGLHESEVLNWLRAASKLPIPVTRYELAGSGLNSESLVLELNRARGNVATLY